MEFLSTAHLVVLALTALLCVLAVVVPRRRPERSWLAWPARGLAVLFVSSEVALRVFLVAQGDWDWATDLPLQLSDAALVAAVVALWSARPPALAVELTYLWAFTATVQALATPALHQGPDHLFFYVFFVTHSGVLVAACYLMWGRRLTLRPGAAWRAFAASAAVATAAGTANVITGGNYMFLRRVPSKGSLLDLMGPWPWYLVSAAGLALALFALLTRLRRSDPAGAWRGLGGLTRSAGPAPPRPGRSTTSPTRSSASRSSRSR